MPRGKSSVSAYDRLRREALGALTELRREIRVKESELNDLRKQEQRLGVLTASGRVANSSAPNGRSASGGRMNWRAVLVKLPKRFKAADIRKVRGLRDKRSGEIFAAVTRWIDTGLVKRKERGVYERTG